MAMDFEFGAGSGRHLRPVRGAVRRRRRRGFGGFGRRSPPPQRGADVAYRLDVPFEDAATLKGQRVTLASGKTIDIKLPPGVEDGAKIRLAGQGQDGPAGAGDAIVTIAIKPHRFFRRDGDDIRLDLPVGLDEAVLGAKVRVPTVDGPVMLSVPKGSTSGKVLRLKGKGFTAKDGQRGDQLVTLMVDVPRPIPISSASSRGGAARAKETRAPAWASSGWRTRAVRDISPESPEARRKRLAASPGRLGAMRESLGAGSRPFEVVRRVAIGVYSDGFIHAGNIAYLTLLSIFPFFILVAAAISHLYGGSQEGLNAVNALLGTMPGRVAAVLDGPMRDVVEARSGRLLWLGALDRAVDHREPGRDDPRHPAAGLRRQLRPAVLGISAGLGRDHRRRGDRRDGRVRLLGRCSRASSSWSWRRSRPPIGWSRSSPSCASSPRSPCSARSMSCSTR